MEVEDGGEGGMDGGGSPGGSISVRFARGVAGESAARGVEGARFGARSSSICSDGGCCKGCCIATVVVGIGGGSGSGGIGGGGSACDDSLS